MSMQVTVVASTMFNPYKAKEAFGYIPQSEAIGLDAMEEEFDYYHNFPNDAQEAQLEDLYKQIPRQIDELSEFAGRNCYQSWERPNPATASTGGYIENILRQQHYSVLEHG